MADSIVAYQKAAFAAVNAKGGIEGLLKQKVNPDITVIANEK